MKFRIGSIVIACCVACCLPVSVSAQSWFDTLPAPLRSAILWKADHEEGTVWDWEYGPDGSGGGCICNTGEDEVRTFATQARAHSGEWGVNATITNAIRADNGSRAVRLMRWTDKHWSLGGQYLPDQAYYSAWFFFPTSYNPNKYAPWDPGDGGWWNVFQFKSDDENCNSQPMWTVNIYHDDDTGEMFFYLFTKENEPSSHDALVRKAIPVREWMHVEAYYDNAPDGQGHIALWQDGVKLFDIPNVNTSLGQCDGNPIWGIGNYTDHIAGGQTEGTATILFDDAAISTRRLGRALTQP